MAMHMAVIVGVLLARVDGGDVVHVLFVCHVFTLLWPFGDHFFEWELRSLDLVARSPVIGHESLA